MFGQKTAFDFCVGILALVLVLAQVYLVLQHWSLLPEQLPTHYNYRGEPDDYGNKFTLWLLPGISIGLFVMLTLVALNPQSMNLPVKITPENQEQVYALGVRFVHLIRLLVSGLFFYLTWGTIRIAMDQLEALDKRFVFLFLGAFGLTLAWFMVQSYQNKQRAESL